MVPRGSVHARDRRSPRRGAHVDRSTRPEPRPTPAFDAALESAAEYA